MGGVRVPSCVGVGECPCKLSLQAVAVPCAGILIPVDGEAGSAHDLKVWLGLSGHERKGQRRYSAFHG